MFALANDQPGISQANKILRGTFNKYRLTQTIHNNSKIMKPASNQPSIENFIELRPHNLKELMALYKISYKTLKKWLKPLERELGERTGYYYTIPQVRKIFEFLGFPCAYYEEGKV
jgi:hypothetical protein